MKDLQLQEAQKYEHGPEKETKEKYKKEYQERDAINIRRKNLECQSEYFYSICKLPVYPDNSG